MGKLISIVWGPWCGKSYLCQKLGIFLNADVLLEWEEKDFPKEIVEDLKTYSNNWELFVWFRNKLIKEIFEAKKISKEKNVIMDWFWMSNFCYIDSFFKDFEKKVAEEFMNIDMDFLPYPDIVILLEGDEQFIRKSIKTRNRSFEIDKIEENVKYFLELQNKYNEIFKHNENFKLVKINRSNMDFNDIKDIKKIVKIIQ